MNHTITIDFETRSYADLPKVGAWAYSEDPTTDVICAAWGIDDQPIQTWWPGKEMKYVPRIPDLPGTPYDLYMALMAGHHVEAHNLGFEWGIWENILTPRYGWKLPDFFNKGRDTMAVACYYGMPAALDKLSRALGYEAKDPAGTRLISKYSKLFLKTATEDIPPDDIKRFVEYCVKDVQIEQSVSDELGELPDRELPIFQLDLQKMRRGLFLDEEGIATATKVVTEREEELVGEFKDLTRTLEYPHGLSPAQHAKVKEWFAANGLELENMQKDTLEDLLEDGELPSGTVRRALEIRIGVNKASTKKLAAMARAAGRDGRAKFQTRYHGAFTGRSTGTGFQPLNLTRGFDDVDNETFPAQLVRDISYGSPKWLDCLYGDAMVAVSNASRYWIRAEEGNRIMSADYASIEAIVLACLAGEQWKIDAFERGEKIYELMGDKIHGLAPGTVTKATHPAERQDGKTGELAFGYRGALGAWLKFDNSGRHSDERIIEICKAWRDNHPEIVSYWDELEEAAIEAVMYPGRETAVRDGGGFEIVDEWLSQELVNGKRIWYRDPEIRSWMPNWHKPKLLVVDDDEGEEIPNPCYTGTCNCKPVPTLTYMSQKLGSWRRVSTYSGKLAENRVQATSREILKHAELNVADAGYDLILDVYDELVAEVPKDFGSVEEFLALVEIRPDYAKHWPLRASVWTGERYRK